MHPRQAALLTRVREVNAKIAATPVMWKYTDPDTGREFYLTERKTSVKSPWTGKAFSAKPEKLSLTNMVKDVKDENKGADE
jgi:hypothetical protein